MFHIVHGKDSKLIFTAQVNSLGLDDECGVRNNGRLCDFDFDLFYLFLVMTALKFHEFM